MLLSTGPCVYSKWCLLQKSWNVTTQWPSREGYKWFTKLCCSSRVAETQLQQNKFGTLKPWSTIPCRHSAFRVCLKFLWRVTRYRTYSFGERYKFSCCTFERVLFRTLSTCLLVHLAVLVFPVHLHHRLVLFHVPQHCCDFVNYKCSINTFTTQIKSRKM